MDDKPLMPINWGLQTGVIDLWYANLDSLALDSTHCLAVLDEHELTVLAGLKHQALKMRYLLCHSLVRLLLASYVQAKPASLNIARTGHGKPYLTDYPRLSFNYSHSSKHLIIALTDSAPIGVDIETIKPRVQLDGLVARCFGLEERQYWQALPEAEKLKVFFEFWTRKEAFVKAEGRGIALGLGRCVIDPENQQRFLSLPDGCGAPEEWSIEVLAVGGGVAAAVAAKLKQFKLNQNLLTDYLKGFG